MIWFDWVLWQIDLCRFLKCKSSLYTYIKYIGFGLVAFYGKSTSVGFLKPNPLYTHITNIYDLVWLGFMTNRPMQVFKMQILFIHIYQIYRIWFGCVLWQIDLCRFFKAKSSLYTYNKYVWFGLVWFYDKPLKRWTAESYYASSFSGRAITFTFGQIPLGKVWTPLSSQLWVK